MKVKVKQVVSTPEIDASFQREIVTQALNMVAARVAAVQGPTGVTIDLGALEIAMPISLDRVHEGYYTPRAAAAFLANNIFKAILPHLPGDARQQDVLKRAVVDGDPEGFKPGGGPPITPDYLTSKNLGPSWRAELSGVRYHLSDLFRVDAKRLACVVFVEEGGSVHTRIYYCSQSQGIWRAASHRLEGLRGIPGMPGDHWIGKGNPHEESTDLPFELMQELTRRASASDIREEIDETTAEGVFYGVLEKFTMEDLLAGRDLKPTAGFFADEARALGTFRKSLGDFGDPGSFEFQDANDAPDFSNGPLQTFGGYSPAVYGEGGLTGFLFPSKNGLLRYLFMKTEDGRAFLASVQDVSSAVTSRGARRQIIDTGNLTMPVWEYRRQIPDDYRGAMHHEEKQYYDAWEYVKRIPIILDLFKSMGWSMQGGRPRPPLLPRRPRGVVPSDGWVRIVRSSGAINTGRVQSVQGGVVVVSVDLGSQVAVKHVPLGALLPCYRVGDDVNVPGMAPQPLRGKVVHADYGGDLFRCQFEDFSDAQLLSRDFPGRDLDHVN